MWEIIGSIVIFIFGIFGSLQIWQAIVLIVCSLIFFIVKCNCDINTDITFCYTIS